MPEVAVADAPTGPRRPHLPRGLRRRLGLLAMAGIVVGGGLVPVACSGGGGLGLAVLTLGASLVFVGASPGYALRDPGLTGGPTTPEDDIVLVSGDGIERCVYLGGELQSPIALEGMAEGTAGASLVADLSLLRADDPTNPIPLSRASIPIQSGQPFRADLSFPSTEATRAYPGDVAIIRLASSGGDVIVETSTLRLGAQIFLNREVRLALAGQASGGPPVLAEVRPAQSGTSLVIPGQLAPTAIYPVAALGSRLYGLEGSPSRTTVPDAFTYRFEGTPRFSLLASATAPGTQFQLDLLEVDAQGVPVGPVLATAGPLVADVNARRLDGVFQTAQPAFELGSTAQNQSVRRLGLRITNLAPQGTDLTLAFDASGADTSLIFLPGPKVLGRTSGGPQILLSQPDPSIVIRQ